jgi:hypothetical protein
MAIWCPAKNMKSKSNHHLAAPKLQWKPSLCLYPSMKALAFPNRRERDRVLESLWTDQELYGMPRDYAGALLLIVPEEAVSVLREKGFKFAVRDVRTG